ncbi:HAD family hydrolase [Bacillus manliponensis]|uniref:HAD family hydrolase n=1 Tax=Bacillus manliponensis TaxID=574376 RepID=UPI003518C231
MKKIQASKILISQYMHYENLQETFKEKANVICTDNGTLVQIMAKHVSKKQAVLDICREHHISMNEVMAFGDDWNDIELFSACRFPIAMENAIQELKEMACYTTRSNDEDGVAYVLEQLYVTTNNK